MTDLSAVRALLLVVAATLAMPAVAQVIYKLVDRQGRVTYSNAEPKNFDGTVTRLETDAGSNVVPSAKAGDAPPRAGASSDVADKRRRTREDLEKKLRAAQDRVEAARKAKADGGDPLPEELQTIQHRYAPLPQGQLPPNPNCFNATDANGGIYMNCPTRVPQDAYFERLKKLDEELRLAEEALELAERAYRRGTD